MLSNTNKNKPIQTHIFIDENCLKSRCENAKKKKSTNTKILIIFFHKYTSVFSLKYLGWAYVNLVAELHFIQVQMPKIAFLIWKSYQL